MTAPTASNTGARPIRWWSPSRASTSNRRRGAWRLRTQRVDLSVETGELKIREVRVEAPAVVRRSDTLTYTVAKYADVADHSIGDVLRKMPGIEVAKSGEIKYNGKAINKFYIEGLDMLEGRYGIATNNVRARDIASVQVFENHQPIKALKELVASDRAALNLKLKEEAKGTWNATLQLGAGYKPWMWNGEATAMYFGRDFQTIDTYKTNNTGDDVSRELTSFYGGLDEASTLLGVHRPTEPSLERERYLDNEIHTISTNAIVKLRKELELTANAHYVHDFQTSEGGSVTTYYLPDAAPLVITEQSLADHRTDRTEVNLQLRSNTERHYLQERLTFGGQWDADYGRVLNDGERVDQRFRLPKITLRNLFTDVRRWGRWAVNFRSETDYTTQPTSLRIRPMLYPEVFDAPADYPDALQTLDSRRFRTRNSAFTAYSVRRWNFSLNAALNAQVERMESSLSAMNAAGATLPAADTLRNDIYWRRLDLIVGPSVGYRIGDRFSASLYVPLDFMSLRTEDRNLGRTTSDNRLLVTPSLTLQSNLTYNLKLSARAAYNEQIGGSVRHLQRLHPNRLPDDCQQGGRHQPHAAAELHGIALLRQRHPGAVRIARHRLPARAAQPDLRYDLLRIVEPHRGPAAGQLLGGVQHRRTAEQALRRHLDDGEPLGRLLAHVERGAAAGRGDADDVRSGDGGLRLFDTLLESRAAGLRGKLLAEPKPHRRGRADRADRCAAPGCRGELHDPQAVDLPRRRRALLQRGRRRCGPHDVLSRCGAVVQDAAHGVFRRGAQPAGHGALPLGHAVGHHRLRLLLPPAAGRRALQGQVQFEIRNRDRKDAGYPPLSLRHARRSP